MLNWLSGGVIHLSSYTAPLIFGIAIFVWYRLLVSYLPVREYYKYFLEAAVLSFIGAALAPIAIFIFQGNLISFISSIPKIFEKVGNFNGFLAIIDLAFRGFSITGGFLILVIILLFVMKDGKNVIFGILYPFPLFAAITRINCIMEGCCFGKKYDGPFSWSYPPASIASKYHYLRFGLISRFKESFSVYPTQLILVILMFLLFLMTYIMNKNKVAKNIIIGTILIGYGVFNFFVEFIRQEPLVLGGPLTMGQFFEIILVILGFYTIFKVNNSQIKG